MTRMIAAGIAVMFAAYAMADDKKGDDKKTDAPLGKLPPLDAKEWKKQESGLEIWEVKEGKGDAVQAGATITIHYIGWLANGKEFDSAKKEAGEPATFPLNRLIKGWQEGIPGMKPGGIRRLKIPASLGYGAKGAGNDIPPNATIIFEIELVK